MGYQIGNIYLIAAIAVIGGGLFGFDIASMSAILPEQPYACYFNQQGFDQNGLCNGPTSSTQGGISAAMPGGSWVGALASGYITDILGRKKSIFVGCCIWLLGSTLSCAAQNIAMLVVGRFINGLCVGICSAQVPVYISELAPPSKRGRLVGIQQWAITWGIMIMFYISYGTSFLKGTAAWRVPWGLQMIPAILLMFALIFMPESPRWLARKNRWEEAESVLALVHAKGDRSSAFVQRELQDIRAYCEFEAKNADVTYWELFKPNMINRTHIGFFTQVWSQLTGMNVMMYYISFVFRMAGKSSTSALLLSSSIQYIINVVMTIPALIYVDRWGRRPTLLIGAVFMMIWMFANAGIISVHGTYQPNGLGGQKEASYLVHGAASTGLIACTYLFVASYAPTWGPVSWIYPPELYPLRVRGKAVALATSGNWIFNFALSYFVPPAFENIGWKVYCLFGAFLIGMFIHVLFLFPETAGKTLEETESMFEDPSGYKYIGTPAWKTRVQTNVVRELERSGSVSGTYAGNGVAVGGASRADMYEKGIANTAERVEETRLEVPAKAV